MHPTAVSVLGKEGHVAACLAQLKITTPFARRAGGKPGGHLIDDDVGEALLASRHQHRHAEASLSAQHFKYAASVNVLPSALWVSTGLLGSAWFCDVANMLHLRYIVAWARHAETVADQHRLRSLHAPPLALGDFVYNSIIRSA